MARSAVGCTVLIDGKAISDGCSPYPPEDPAVLSGLRVTWGRDTPVDQPQPSSATFSILDPIDEGARLVGSLTIGRRVDVRTDSVVYPDPTVSTIPVLIPGPVEYATVSGSGTTSNVAVEAGSYGARAVSVTYPPKAYTSDPTGWDAVPRSLPGQAWRLKAAVSIPAVFLGSRKYALQVRPVAFTDPAGPGTALGDVAAPVIPPSGDALVDLTFTPPPGVWLGLQVRIYPAGPAWLDLDTTAWQDAGATTWDALATFTIRNVQMLAPAAGAVTTAYVFSGRITDLTTSWDGGPDLKIDIIAQDWLAELANRPVGDQPWSVETIGSRAARIIALSGQPVSLTVDSPLAALSVTYRDVDRQPAATLLQQLATSGAGILWTATHPVTGQVMRIEDPAKRPAAKTLQAAGAPLVVTVVVSPASIANGMPLSACVIDAEPVRFILDTIGTVSSTELTWKEQTTGSQGEQKPTDRTVSLTDPGLLQQIGARRLSVSTQLALAGEAGTVAQTYLTRSSVLAWQVDGLHYDTAGDLDPAEIQTIMRLLDGTRRIGLPLSLTDLPPWAQEIVGSAILPLYVEGGEYQYLDGAWTLQLATSSATASGAGVYPWSASPTTWAWSSFSPDVSWNDLYGVTYPPV